MFRGPRHSADYTIELVTAEERWRVTERTRLETVVSYYQRCSSWSGCTVDAADVVGQFGDCHTYVNGPRR
jgi:hypothetical protein